MRHKKEIKAKLAQAEINETVLITSDESHLYAYWHGITDALKWVIDDEN